MTTILQAWKEAMDSTQLGITPTSSSSTTAIQTANSGTEADSPSGFARLFSMIKNKADALSHEDSAANGKTKPEFGKDLPLKYAGSQKGPADKLDTAVLSTNAERTNPEIEAEKILENGFIPPLGEKISIQTETPLSAVLSTNTEHTNPEIGSEKILENGFIPPLEEKINIQGKTPLSSTADIPKINLPLLDSAEEKLIPAESAAIAAANIISAKSKDTPAIASTDNITSLQKEAAIATGDVAEKSSQKQASNIETNAHINGLKSLSQATLSNTQPNSAVTIDSKISESENSFAGISTLNRDLNLSVIKPIDKLVLATPLAQDAAPSPFNSNPATTSLQAGSDNAVKEVQPTSVAPPNITTSSVKQIELAQIEIGEKSVLAQSTNEKTLVEASFQRPFVDSKTAEIKAAEDKQFIKNITSHPVQNAEVKLEDAAIKATLQQNQSFEEMWNKANSVEDLVNKTRMEQILGSRPASELSQAVRGPVQPATNIELPLSTKPSLATQTLFSLSSNSTNMPSSTLNFNQTGWEKSLAQNVSWMTGNNIKTLQVSITPAELGPIHIHASMEQDKLNLQVNAQNGMTRETLEAAIPRLRDLLDKGSYSSVNVDVSSGGFEQNKFSQNENIKEFNQTSESELEELPVHQAATQTASKIGLIDTFA